MANRLAHATSPYLIQHAENPVDWWQWGDAAFEEARRRDVPILLSVGYASCHWCHVMAHESFEDPTTAHYMNEHFVNIKVDREERPDVDAVYMRATQAMTGHGGWPMTCVLTHTGEPFFTGTYFPPQPKHNTPAFTQVLQAIAEAWTDRRDDIGRIAADVMAHLSEQPDIGGGALTATDLDEAVTELARSYDSESGGFGVSPKFPPSMVLEFLLRHHDRTGSAAAWQMVEDTCEQMARGGIYDQLSGGFARYAVDRFWQVPHFEKMLYDNALLLRVYLHWWRQSGSPLAERIVAETAEFLLTELCTPEGGFASGLDADSPDSDGAMVEGEFYGWSPHQFMKVLGTKDATFAIQQFGVTASGTFERGLSTLQRGLDPVDLERYERIRQSLLEARSTRVRPARDDKVIAAWNGWTITALAEASILLDRPDLLDAAIAAANLLVRVHRAGESDFVRTSRGGIPSPNRAVLDDHGAVAEAFLALLGATGDVAWLDRARSLLDRVIDRFIADDGGFFDTADDSEPLVVRPRDDADNAHPSGASAAIHALIGFSAVTGERHYRQVAEQALAASSRLATGAPRFAGSALAAAEALLAGPLEVAVVGTPEARKPLHRAALMLTSPGAAVVAAEPGLAIGLFESKSLVGGQAAAYVCRNFTCDLPVTDPAHLAVPRG